MSNRYSLILAFFVFFLSFSFNIFHITDDFESFQNDSEELVIDGMTRYNKTGDFSLGRYTHPKNPPADYNFYQESVEVFKNGTPPDVEFKKYISQYGLQGHFFVFIADVFKIKSIKTLKILNAIIFSFTLLIIFNWLFKKINRVSAFIFLVSISLSPWVVNFSNNLYWVPFTWILPVCVTLSYSIKAAENSKSLFFYFLLISFAFFIKFLSGYEFITTIGLLSMLPILYFYLTKAISSKTAMKLFLVVSMAFFTAFGFSLAQYVQKFGKHQLYETVVRRVDVGAITSAEACKTSDIDGCAVFVNSLNSNGFIVVARYILTFDGLLPYTKYFPSEEVRKLRIESKEWAAFKNRPSFQSFSNLNGNLITALSLRLASSLVFPLLLIVCFWVAFRNKKELIFLFCCLLPPISWFAMAKGHSYIHFHLNFVLWYLPFVPSAFIYLYNKSKLRKS